VVAQTCRFLSRLLLRCSLSLLNTSSSRPVYAPIQKVVWAAVYTDATTARHGTVALGDVARWSDGVRIVALRGVPTKTALSLLSSGPLSALYRGSPTARGVDGLSLDRVLGLFLLACRGVQSISGHGPDFDPTW